MARRWAGRAVLALLAVCGALLALELGVRLLWTPPAGGYPPGLFVADDDVGYRLAPNFAAEHTTPDYSILIRTDARGYRVPRGPAPPPSRTDVIALGDSFCFGHGVEAEDAYPAVLAGLLSVERGTPATVVNTGAPGYGTHNATALLAADGPALAPEVVVLGVYLGNDFRDNDARHFGRLTARSGVLVTIDEDTPPWEATLKAALAVHWHSAQLLLRGFGASAEPTPEAAVEAFCQRLDWDAAFTAAMVQVPWSERVEAAVATTRARLDDLAALCSRRGYRLLVALLPAPYQYHAALWNIVVERCGLRAEDYDMTRPGDALLAWGRDRDVAVLDLLPAFRTATEAGEHLYLDVHFNAAGHRLAATEILVNLPRAKVPPTR